MPLIKSLDRYNKWIRLIGRPDLQARSYHAYICETHFKHEDFEYQPMMKGKLLKPDVEPSLHLPEPAPETSDDADKFARLHKATQCQIEQHHKSPSSLSNLERRKLSKRMNYKIIFDQLCDKFFPKNISYIVKSQISVKSALSKEKCTTEYQHFCMYLYHTSPAVYMALQKSFNLPSKKDLINNCKFYVSQGLTSLLKTLKPKIDCLSELGKICSVFICGVELKPHLYYHIAEDMLYGFCDAQQKKSVARYAMVIMVCGIYEQWTLPIDYGLFSRRDDNARANWIHNTIQALLEAGLKVRVCMSNIPSRTMTAPKPQPHVAPETPFFYVDDASQLYYVYDPTYLMTSMYKYFMKHEFHYRDSIAKWEDVVKFYESDCKKTHRLAPELTERHVASYDSEKNNAKLAIETLNDRVAAGISAYIDFGQMDQSAKGTVYLLTMMSRFFKFMSSSKAHESTFDGDDCQTEFVIEALKFFNELKVIRNGVDITKDSKILKQIQVSIKAIMLLFEDLTENNVHHLCTSNIKFDFINNFINRIIDKSPSKDITAWRLISAFRKMVFHNVLKTTKKKTCPDLVSTIFEEFVHKDNSCVIEAPRFAALRLNYEVSKTSLMIKITDYKDFKLPKENQLIKICEFLLRKTWEKHEICSLLEIKKTDAVYSRYNSLYGCRENNTDFKLVPDDKFICFVEKLDEELKWSFDRYFHTKRLFVQVRDLNGPVFETFQMPCQCFPYVFMIRLFFRLRISQQLKLNNRRFNAPNGNKILFEYENFK